MIDYACAQHAAKIVWLANWAANDRINLVRIDVATFAVRHYFIYFRESTIFA
jgi:hypothetical protein